MHTVAPKMLFTDILYTPHIHTVVFYWIEVINKYNNQILYESYDHNINERSKHKPS